MMKNLKLIVCLIMAENAYRVNQLARIAAVLLILIKAKGRLSEARCAVDQKIKLLLIRCM